MTYGITSGLIMSNYKIPFNRPFVGNLESEYILNALNNRHLSGDGPFARKCQELLEKELKVARVFLTTSCTHALEMSALLLDIAPGEEVIVPSFTFVSTVNAFVLRGAKPVFADIRPDTLNINENSLKNLITKKTRAVIPVHYAGVGCEMDFIMHLANNEKISVVEDNAHGLFGKYNKKHLGTFGKFAALSFHETKNFTCGEGGALLINDPEYIERAEIIREKGTDRSSFFRGEVDKYTWRDLGSSYLPSEVLSAILFAQLEKKDEIINKRMQIWNHYSANLQEWAEKENVKLPVVPEHCNQPFHMYYLILPSLNMRQALIEHLKNKGILSVFHYQPLHLSPMGLKFGGKTGDCPVTEDISQRLLRLPFYTSLRQHEQQQVIETILQFNAKSYF